MTLRKYKEFQFWGVGYIDAKGEARYFDELPAIFQLKQVRKAVKELRKITGYPFEVVELNFKEEKEKK